MGGVSGEQYCRSAPTHLQGWEGGSCWWAHPSKVENYISPGIELREGSCGWDVLQCFPGSVESFAEPAFAVLTSSSSNTCGSRLSWAGAQQVAKIRVLSLTLNKQLCSAWASGQPGPACPGPSGRCPGSGSVSSLPCLSEEGGRDGGGAGATGTAQVAGLAG